MLDRPDRPGQGLDGAALHCRYANLQGARAGEGQDPAHRALQFAFLPLLEWGRRFSAISLPLKNVNELLVIFNWPA